MTKNEGRAYLGLAAGYAVGWVVAFHFVWRNMTSGWMTPHNAMDWGMATMIAAMVCCFWPLSVVYLPLFGLVWCVGWVVMHVFGGG